jgi:HEAT repeat protein
VRAAAARALAALATPSATAAVARRAPIVLARLSERRARWIAAPPAPSAPPPFIDPVAPEEAVEAGSILAAMGALKLPDSEATLLAHTQDLNREVRAGAVEGLAFASSARAVGALTAALGDPSFRVREAAAEALGRSGARGAAPLAAAAREAGGASAEWRIVLSRALGETQAAEAVPALEALLDGASASAAAAGLSRIGAPAAAPPLVAYLGRPREPSRADAVEALSQLAARDAAPAIAALLTDDRPEVRAAAARALGKLRYEEAAARLEALRSDYYGRVRRAAVEALAKLPSGAQRAGR